MAQNITSSGSTVVATQADAVLIQVNAALTGTITVSTPNSTIATITNPTVGLVFRYGGLHGQGALSVNPSTTCDISVTLLSKVS